MSFTPTLSAAASAAASSPPAGGAELGQVIIATAAGALLTSVLLVLGIGHRTGRLALLGRIGAYAERRIGMPAWAALPTAIITPSLIIALFGMMWDISIHIDQGRDAGPLANPAHYFIPFGLFGIFTAGLLAIVLPTEKPSGSAIKISGDWYAPLGGVIILACGAFSLIGFPLDDVWHRMFGQDVTLWGPTHLMLIGGAVMTVVGLALLMAEAGRLGPNRAPEEPGYAYWMRNISLPGAFLIGLSTFQAEFDYGVPQFRFVFAPMLVMLAAGAALVAARMISGRGAAIGAVAFFLAIRGAYTLIIGPDFLGNSVDHFPIYLPEAILIELVALAISPLRRPLAFGLGAGAAVGTVGLAAEWGWSHIWSPIPWPAELFPEGALLGFAMAMTGALIGAWVGARLRSDVVARRPDLRRAGIASAAVVAILVAFALYKPADEGVQAAVALTDVQSGPERTVDATVTLDPPNAADDAEWLTVTSWQGDGLIVDRLQRESEGVYRTTQPIPVHSDWKSLVRLQNGNSLTSLPIFLPEDTAIPAPEVPASAQFTRTFVDDHKVLQREQKDTAAWLPLLGYGVVLAITLALLVLVAWGLHRLAVVQGGPGGPASTASDRSRKTSSTTGTAGAGGGTVPQAG